MGCGVLHYVAVLCSVLQFGRPCDLHSCVCVCADYVAITSTSICILTYTYESLYVHISQGQTVTQTDK